MSMCRALSCVAGKGCLLWPLCFLDKTLLAFVLLHFVLQGQTCLLPQVSLDFLLLHSNPLWWKGHCCLVLFLEGLVDLHRISKLQIFQHQWLGDRLGLLWSTTPWIWSTIAFWILVKPLHLRTMLSKWMRCTKNCTACSQHWSTERAQFFSTTKLDSILYNQCFKSWTNWATKFCLIHHIHLTSLQPSITSSSISITFCRENASTTSIKCFPRIHQILKHGFLHYRNKLTYFSLAKMCWL